ncbi:MAG TPA: hypothetical protein VGS05_10585 [Candidatus Sulfotelmatobacter sp.]|nr:hypothetical protein [Candidatus Sulfotelmatobacter sp.]
MTFARWTGLSTLLSAALLLTLPHICMAQDNSAGQSWSATDQQTSPTGAFNPSRTQETHTKSDGRVVDNASTETMGPDGRYVPYSDTEKESRRINDTTVRNIERTYGRDVDGRRVLIQERQEESRTLPGGEQKVTRTISNPDGNGALQVVQREIEDSKQPSPGVRVSNTTALTPDSDGRFSAVVQTQQRETKASDGSVQFQRSTQLPDGNGGWTLSEVREGRTRQDGQNVSKEESVLRPNADGKLSVVERTVNKQVQSSTGEKRDTTETYSTNVPGEAGDGSLQLVQRATTVQRTTASGAQSTVRQIEQPQPGDFSSSLQVTQEAIDIVRPGTNCTTSVTRTVLAPGPDGGLNQVWVDFGSSDKPPAIAVDSGTPSRKK